MQTTDDAIREEYERLAPEYETRWAHYLTSTIRKTLERIQVAETNRVLDVACGTGLLLSNLDERVSPGVLVGMDLSAGMLKRAQSRLRDGSGLVQGNTRSLPFSGSQFDLVLCCNSFHYFAKPVQCLNEIRRVLRPSGRLVLTDWCDDYWACWICDWYLRVTSDAYHRAYTLQECESMLREAGFETISIERYKIDWLWGLMTAKVTSPGA